MAGLHRRDVMILGAIAALMVGWQKFGQRGPVLDFVPVPDAAGWRFATAGSISGMSGTDFLTLGLSNGVDPLAPERLQDVVHRDTTGDAVPVAVFSDFFCPYCRVLVGQLKARSTGRPIAITWHELPLLGDNSVLAAKAAEAAALQGGYVAFYNQLLADGFRPSTRWMLEVADRAGLNAARIDADMTGARVAARLADTASAARRLGFFATPGLVIGKTAILGALDPDQIEDLIVRA